MPRASAASGTPPRRRRLLGVADIAELPADTTLDSGLSVAAKVNEFNKQSSLRDVSMLTDAEKGFSNLEETAAAAIVNDLGRLEADPALFAASQRRSFIEKGLELVEGPDCPLCDDPWENEEHLREYLKAKLAKAEETRKLQEALLKNGTAIAQEVVRVTGLIGPVQKIAARAVSCRNSRRGASCSMR